VRVEPSCCYTTHWIERPPPPMLTHRSDVTGPCTAPAPAAFCPDCTAARLSRIHPGTAVATGDWPPVEPSAPPLTDPAAADQGDPADPAGATAFCLPRRPSSPPLVAARCYRYIASSSSAPSHRQSRSSVGRSTRSYNFRSLVPGGDAFPVPPPAYDDYAETTRPERPLRL